MSLKKQPLREVNNARTWKRIRLSAVLGCPICGPNSGCNRRNKKLDNSWKSYRKTQYYEDIKRG